MGELIRQLKRSSFLEGFGRVLDIGGRSSRFMRDVPTRDDDTCAVASDWEAVGRDIESAMRLVAEEVRPPAGHVLTK